MDAALRTRLGIAQFRPDPGQSLGRRAQAQRADACLAGCGRAQHHESGRAAQLASIVFACAAAGMARCQSFFADGAHRRSGLAHPAVGAGFTGLRLESIGLFVSVWQAVVVLPGAVPSFELLRWPAWLRPAAAVAATVGSRSAGATRYSSPQAKGHGAVPMNLWRLWLENRAGQRGAAVGLLLWASARAGNSRRRAGIALPTACGVAARAGAGPP